MAKETFTKKIKSEFKKGLPKNIKAQISEQISAKMNTRLGKRINKSAHKAQKTATAAAEKTVQIATETAHIAAETAKHGLDQVLLGLEHRGINVKDSQDIAQKVGKKVLERAEAIRAQIATSPFSPAWLKDVKITSSGVTSEKPAAHAKVAEEKTSVDTGMSASAASSLTDATASLAAEEAQPEQFEMAAGAATVDENDEDITAMQKPAKKTKRPATKGLKSSASARAEK